MTNDVVRRRQEEQKLREQKRLDDFKKRFLRGEAICGEAFLDITKRDGFKIETASKRHFRHWIAAVNYNGSYWTAFKKGRYIVPDLNPCGQIAKDYYKHLISTNENIIKT